MLVNNIGNGVEQVNGLEYLKLGLGTVLYRRVLGLSQLARLVERIGRDEHFAQVMKECRQANGIDLALSQAHLPAYGAGELAHTRLMASRGRVLLLDDHLYGPDGVLQEFAQLGEGVVQNLLILSVQIAVATLQPACDCLLAEGLAIIREKNPTRTVIVGPAFWNSIDHLAELELPAADRNLIVTVHYYTPMDFTHQGAAWADRKDKLGVEWLGTEEERGVLKRDFDKAASWAKQHDRPLFLGEFGAYDKAPMESRARYLASVTRAAEQRGWSWAYWQFDSDFILYDIGRDSWIEPVRRALIPAAGP